MTGAPTVLRLDGAPPDPAALAALALTNYGHFTTMRVERGAVRGLDLHLRRLSADCVTVFGAELDTGRVRRYVRDALDGPGPVHVRVTVFDPALRVGRAGADADPAVLVACRPAPPAAAPPMRVRPEPYLRESPRVKHVGLFGALARRRAAQRAGFDDALFTTADGALAEGTTWNVALLDGDGLVWPDAPALPGVTAALLRAAYGGTRRRVTVADLPRYAGVLALDAGAGPRELAAVGAHGWPGGHPFAAELRRGYAALPAEPL